MAFVNEGTVVSLSSRQVPVDFVDATINKFQDYEDTRLFELEVDRDTVADPDPATTLGNIISNATIGVTKQITDVYTQETDDTANNVSVWSVIQSLDHNISPNRDSDFLKNTAVSFKMKVLTYYKNDPV